MYASLTGGPTSIANLYIRIIYYYFTLNNKHPYLKRYIMPAGAVFSSLINFDIFKKKKKKTSPSLRASMLIGGEVLPLSGHGSLR